MSCKDTPASRELDYRLSKWILRNIEQLLEPDEIKAVWTELLSFYSPYPVDNPALDKWAGIF